MNRWKVWNLNYRAIDASCRRLIRDSQFDAPWVASAGVAAYRTFATQAEAITYADKQARRTT